MIKINTIDLDQVTVEHVLENKPEGANGFDFLANCYIHYIENSASFQVYDKRQKSWESVKASSHLTKKFITFEELKVVLCDLKLIGNFGSVKKLKSHYDQLVDYHDKNTKYFGDRLLRQLNEFKRIVETYS